jgi:hypothetical protein
VIHRLLEGLRRIRYVIEVGHDIGPRVRARFDRGCSAQRRRIRDDIVRKGRRGRRQARSRVMGGNAAKNCGRGAAASIEREPRRSRRPGVGERIKGGDRFRIGRRHATAIDILAGAVSHEFLFLEFLGFGTPVLKL